MRAWPIAVLVAACSGQPEPDPSGGPDAAATDPDAVVAPGPDAAHQADAAPFPFDCAPESAPGHQEVGCDDGVVYDVEVSADCAAGGCGLILDLHGFTMTADELDDHTRMRALAPPLGYIVVQPTAPGLTPSWAGGGHDAAVWEFLRATAARFDVDADRVHVMGFSQGGEMTLRLLCDHADEIASVAPAAGSACFDSGAPAVERPILYTHGTDDVLINYGSTAEPLRDAVVETWELTDYQVMAQTDGYTAERWADGGGTVFELWSHDFATEAFYLVGHCLPGPVTTDTYRCRDEGQFDHSLEVLRFFGEHPR